MYIIIIYEIGLLHNTKKGIFYIKKDMGDFVISTVNRKIRVNGIWEAFRKKTNSRFYFKDYANSFFRLIYAFEGSLMFQNNDKKIILKSGEIAIVNGGDVSFIESNSSKSAFFLSIAFDASGMLTEKITQADKQLPVKAADKLCDILKVLETAGASEDNYIKEPGNSFIHELANLLEILLLALTENREEYVEEKIRLSNEFKEILDIMRENVEKPLTVKEIASLCGMSESSLKKIFAKYSACSVHKYFLKMKVFKAIELLDNQYNVAEISEKLSFNNQNYFGVVFKKETGFSPLKYRKKFLHNN